MRYIVGYTATPAGTDALVLGVRLARSRGAELELVMVLHSEHRPTLAPSDPAFARMVDTEARGWLAEAASNVSAEVPVHTTLLYAESFSEGLMAAAEESGAELIVVGAARDGILGRFTTGSVAADLLHSSTQPVALAPSGTAEAGMGHNVSRVTAAIGTKAGADAVLAAGIQLAAGSGAALRIVSLVALDLPGGADDPEVTRVAAQHAREVLDSASAHLPDGVSATAELALGSSIENAVSRMDWDPDEVAIVGSSRLAQPRRLFIGSTAAKMLRELPVPMIVVPRSSTLTVGE